MDVQPATTRCCRILFTRLSNASGVHGRGRGVGGGSVTDVPRTWQQGCGNWAVSEASRLAGSRRSATCQCDHHHRQACIVGWPAKTWNRYRRRLATGSVVVMPRRAGASLYNIMIPYHDTAAQYRDCHGSWETREVVRSDRGMHTRGGTPAPPPSQTPHTSHLSPLTAPSALPAAPRCSAYLPQAFLPAPLQPPVAQRNGGGRLVTLPRVTAIIARRCGMLRGPPAPPVCGRRSHAASLHCVA